MSWDSIKSCLFGGQKKYKIRCSIIVWLLLEVISLSMGARMPKQLHYVHTNLCSHVVPEPTVYLSNMFNTKDYFYPQYFREIKCRSPKATGASSKIKWDSCMNGQYHCVTRYRKMSFLRMPNPGNGTFDTASYEEVLVGVGCECSSFIII